MRKPIIGVMGRGEGAAAKDVQAARELGKLIAEEGWMLLTGGVNTGVMQAATSGAKEAGGLTIGIIPRRDTAIAEGVDIPIITDMGSARNNINALTSDVLVACGVEGPGTSSEVSFALQDRTSTPVVLLDCGEIAEKFFRSLRDELVHTARTPQEAAGIIRKLVA